MQISESTCVDGPRVNGAFNGRKPEENDDKWIDKRSQTLDLHFLTNDRKSLCTKTVMSTWPRVVWVLFSFTKHHRL